MACEPSICQNHDLCGFGDCELSIWCSDHGRLGSVKTDHYSYLAEGRLKAKEALRDLWQAHIAPRAPNAEEAIGVLPVHLL